MAIARLFSAFAFLLNTRLRKNTERNLRLCFKGLSQRELNEQVKESLANSFYLFFEYAYMSNWDHQRLLSLFTQVDGLDLLEGAIKKRKGVLLLLPHFGNFEILQKKARPGRNPKTGEDVIISARKVVTFRAGNKLRKKINSFDG